MAILYTSTHLYPSAPRCFGFSPCYTAAMTEQLVAVETQGLLIRAKRLLTQIARDINGNDSLVPNDQTVVERVRQAAADAALPCQVELSDFSNLQAFFKENGNYPYMYLFSGQSKEKRYCLWFEINDEQLIFHFCHYYSQQPSAVR